MLITPQRLWHATYGIGVLALVIFSYTFFFRHELPAEDIRETVQEIVFSMPHSFQQKDSLHESLKRPFFALASTERPLRLPDLRNNITFLGSNERPDLSLEKMRMQFVLRGSSPTTVNAGEKVYLRFDGHTNRYNISENPTSLSLVFHPRDGGADVTEEIQDETGSVITTPTELHRFYLPATSSPQTGSSSRQKWNVGDFTAGPLLLEQQGACWYGYDKMIETLGGEEFAYQAARDRVQFRKGAEAYVVWVKEKDCFIFDGENWKEASLGDETKGKILLRAKKIDENEMFFDLWNSDGSLHSVCKLNRRENRFRRDPPVIRIIGARSQTRWFAEIEGKRIVLSPSDWLVFTEEGATKIETSALLDSYIRGALSGPMLALTGIKKVNNELCFTGLLFDSARTEKIETSIPLYRAWSKPSPNKNEANEEEEDDDDIFNDDDDDDDDDDDEDVEDES